jgi:hypothetical protein
MLSSNLMSFSSPAILSDGLLKPEAHTQQSKPCDLVLQAANSPSDLFGSKTSTPFDGEPHTPRFKFENQLVDIMEDPFDDVERKAVQFTNNDPFDVVSAAAAAYTSDTVNTTNSLMNCAFDGTGNSSTGLTVDFEKLGITSARSILDSPTGSDEQKTSPLQSNGQNGLLI